METTMTDTDKVIQVAASRIQGLTRQVNHWKDRTEELEAALGIEKAARISAEATRDRALNAGAANVELQEELRKERAEHQETCRYLADAQAKVRELLSERDGLFTRLRQSIAHRDFAEIALAEAHEAIWGLGCEMTNLRCDLATARDECNRALGKFVDVKVSQVFDCTKDFLRAEIADLRMTFDAVHYALGIKSGDNIIEAIDKLKQERDCAKDEWDREEERCKGLASDIEVLRVELRESQKEAVTARQDAVTRAEADRVRFVELFNDRQRLQAELAVIKDERNELRGKLEASEAESRVYFEKSKELAVAIQQLEAPRQHPVKVGEYLRRLTGFNTTPAGEIARVIRVHVNADSVEYDVLRPNGEAGTWIAKNCTPCDPPEATHITPAGKLTALAAVTPQPEDKVRLVRVPTKQDCKEYDYTDPEQVSRLWSECLARLAAQCI